tara:strand:- start:203 stop:466 length:264 start_codon:yes stop_codon:yes gene_type:complete
MTTEIEETVAAIKEKQEQREKLLDKLLRYRNFEAEYGIAPHEISRILLKPVDRKESEIVYDSYVTTKNGEEHVFLGVNIKAILDGDE